MNTQIEIYCGSYYDARQAETGGAKRTELNSVSYIGGLTSSVTVLRLIKEHTKLSAMTIIRPHGAGFHYPSQDYDAMVGETRGMIENGAGGIVFSCLDAYGNIDAERSEHIAALAEANHKRAVFRRAFDYVKDPFKTIETLINMGVDCMFTSGTYPMALEGEEIIRQLQERYGDRIEILAGCGIDTMSAEELIAHTGVKQIRSSCEDWLQDETTCDEHATYSYGPRGHKNDYEAVNSEKVRHLIWNVRQSSTE